MTQVSFAEVGASLSVSKMNSLDFSSASSQNTFSPQAAFESAQGVSWLMTAFILDDYLYLRKNSWFSESKMGQIIDQVFQRPAVQEEEMLLQKFMKIWYENLPEVVQNLQSSHSFLDRLIQKDPDLKKHSSYYPYILYDGLGKTHNMALKMIFDLELTSDIKAKSLRLLDISHQFLCVSGDMQRASFRILQIFSVSKDPAVQKKVRQYLSVLQQKPNMEFWGNLYDPKNWLVAGSAWMMWKGLQLSSVVTRFLSNYSNLEKATAASVGLHVLAYLGLQKVLPHDLPQMMEGAWQASSAHVATPDLVVHEISSIFRNSWTYKNNYQLIQTRLFDWLISGEFLAYGEFKKLPFEKSRQIYIQAIQAKQKILDSVLQLKKENKIMDKAGIISVRSALQNFLVQYSKDEPFLIQGLSKGTVNCVSRTLLLMATFMPLEDLLKAQGLQPAIMGFSNHLDFVLFHEKSGRAFSLLTLNDMSSYLGQVSLYHPYVLLRQFLVNQHALTNVSVGEFVMGPGFQIAGPTFSENPFVQGLLVTSLKYEGADGQDGISEMDFSSTQILDSLPMSNGPTVVGKSMESSIQIQPDLTYTQTWRSASVPLFSWEILPAPATMQEGSSSRKSWKIYHQVQGNFPSQKLTHSSLSQALRQDLQSFFNKYKFLSNVVQPLIFQPDVDRDEVLALMRLMKFYEKYLLIENSFPKDLRKDLQKIFLDYNLAVIRYNLQTKLQYFYMWTQSSREPAIFHRWWNSLTEQQQLNVYLQKQLFESVYRTSVAHAEQQVQGANAYLNFYRLVSKKDLCTVTNEPDPLTFPESEEWKQVNAMKRNKDQFKLLPLSIPVQSAEKSGFVIELQLRPRSPNDSHASSVRQEPSDVNPVTAAARNNLGIKVSRSLMSIMNVSQNYEGPQNCAIPPEEQMLLQQKVLQTQILMKKMGF